MNEWENVAKDKYQEGIQQKFLQNQALSELLVQCTKNKQIVECASDCLWATGVLLSKDDCLDKSMWQTPGILGEILGEIRDELTSE